MKLKQWILRRRALKLVKQIKWRKYFIARCRYWLSEDKKELKNINKQLTQHQN